MVILLHGPDSYRRTEKAKELILAYRKKYENADLFSVDFEDDSESFTRARDFLKQPSMFADSKVLFVKEPAMVIEKEWGSALREAVDAKGVVVILSANEDPTEAFPFLGKKSVVRQEFKEIEGRVLEMFVLREAKVRGITFEPAALRFFLAYLGSLFSRSARAMTELERMASAKFPLPITRAHIEELTAWLPSEELYRGVKAVYGGHSALERLTALERLLIEGEAAAKLFNIIGYAADGANAATLAVYDIAVKSGRLEYEEALTDFSISLPTGQAGAPGTSAITRAEFFLRDVI